MDQLDDKELWKMAKRRVKFRTHLYSYIIINAFLWGIWFLTGGGGSLWPAWVTLGWGVGLAFDYASAYYKPTDKDVQKEFEKMKNNGQS